MTALVVWLFDATIKGSLLIVLVALLHRALAPRVDARWRHLLWIVVLVRLLLPVAPSSPFSAFNLLPGPEPLALRETRMEVEPRPASLPADGEPLELAVATPAILVAARWFGWIWIAGVVFIALRIGISTSRMWRAVRTAIRCSDGRGAGGMLIVESDAVRTPALHGLIRPVLLLPRGFTSAFSAEELRHVVLHELWHVRRFDVAVSWLAAAAQTIHWFNPLVWFAVSRIREERELSCDELALSLLEEEERPGYGRTILKLLERCRAAAPVPALVGIVNDKEKMKRRLLMIASFRNRTRLTIVFLTLVAAVSAVALTDAKVVERRLHAALDPTAIATIEKLQQPVSFDLNNASLTDLITAVSNATGVVVTQAPEAATSPVQSARFHVTSENVPAHVLLMEALRPFELDAVPTAEGVTIAKGDGKRTIRLAHRRGIASDEDVIITHKGGERLRVEKVLEDREGIPEGATAEVHERVVVHKIENETTAESSDDRKVRREVTIRTERNGQKAEGKLTIEIVK